MSQEFQALAAPYFRLVPEVWMRHLDGHRLRIDFLAWPLDVEQFPVKPPLIGFEIKREHESFNTYSKVLKQAIDYRHSVIEDARLPEKAQGRELTFVFVYPPFESDLGWDGGAIRLAGRYNVGVASIESNWRGEEALTLRCSDERLWDSLKGPRTNLGSFGTGRGRGSK